MVSSDTAEMGANHSRKEFSPLLQQQQQQTQQQLQQQQMISSSSTKEEAIATAAATTSGSRSSQVFTTTTTTVLAKEDGHHVQQGCTNCAVKTSPVWRRGPAGPKTLCNACGLKWSQGKMLLDNKGKQLLATTPSPSLQQQQAQLQPTTPSSIVQPQQQQEQRPAMATTTTSSTATTHPTSPSLPSSSFSPTILLSTQNYALQQQPILPATATNTTTAAGTTTTTTSTSTTVIAPVVLTHHTPTTTAVHNNDNMSHVLSETIQKQQQQQLPTLNTSVTVATPFSINNNNNNNNTNTSNNMNMNTIATNALQTTSSNLIAPQQQQQPTITTPTSKQQLQQANKRKSSGKSSISSAHASTEEPISHGKPLRLKKSGKTGRKICSNCGVIKTPVWRKGPLGTGTLCNACGLKYSLGTITLDPETGAVPGKQSFLEIVSDTEESSTDEESDDMSDELSQQQSLFSSSSVMTTRCGIGGASQDASISGDAHDEGDDDYHDDDDDDVNGEFDFDAIHPNETDELAGRRRGNKKGGVRKGAVPSKSTETVFHVSSEVQHRSVSSVSSSKKPPTTPRRGSVSKKGKKSPRLSTKSRSVPKNVGASVSRSHQGATGKKLMHRDHSYRKDSMEDDLDDEVERRTGFFGSYYAKQVKDVREPGSDYSSQSDELFHRIFGSNRASLKRSQSQLDDGSKSGDDEANKRQKMDQENALIQCQILKMDRSKHLYPQDGVWSLMMTSRDAHPIHQFLAPDTMTYLMMFLDVKSLYSCMSVCKKWNQLTNDHRLWMNLYDKQWGIHRDNLKTYTQGTMCSESQLNWKKLFQARRHITDFNDIQQAEFMFKFYVVEKNPKMLVCVMDKVAHEWQKQPPSSISPTTLESTQQATMSLTQDIQSSS